VEDKEESRKRSFEEVERRSGESDDDWIGRDDEICFEDVKIEDGKNGPEGELVVEDKASVSKQVEVERGFEADRDFDEEFDDASDWKGNVRSHDADTELGENCSSRADKEARSHKRKIGRSDVSPSWDVSEKPSKRNKVTVDGEMEIAEIPRKLESRRETVIEPLEQPQKIQNVDGWICSQRDHSLEDEADVSVFYEKQDDLDTTTQRLLRITNPGDITDSSGRRFGKCFRKRYKKVPCRVEFFDADDNSWTYAEDQ